PCGKLYVGDQLIKILLAGILFLIGNSGHAAFPSFLLTITPSYISLRCPLNSMRLNADNM
ncbi:hypothetical protein OFB83_26680, partial [Escherichia coli]|nr:hypothetical protein [Escherichia coli]